MRPIESLLVNKGMGRGSSWSLDMETLESDVSSCKSAGSIAKDSGWPSSSVRQRVAAIKRGDPSPRYVGGGPLRLTPELLDEMRELKGHPLSALASVGDPHSAPSGGLSHP